MDDMNIDYNAESNQTRLVFTTKTPDKLETMKFATEIEKLENLAEFKLDDKVGD